VAAEVALFLTQQNYRVLPTQAVAAAVADLGAAVGLLVMVVPALLLFVMREHKKVLAVL
jgi:hypothetical protein